MEDMLISLRKQKVLSDLVLMSWSILTPNSAQHQISRCNIMLLQPLRS